jgi:hypothetical protein
MAEVQVAGEVDSGDYEGAEARKVAYAASSVATFEHDREMIKSTIV